MMKLIFPANVKTVALLTADSLDARAFSVKSLRTLQ